jgi:hypothetical protein
VKVQNWAQDANVRIYNGYGGTANFLGHFRTNFIIENNHATRVGNFISDGTITLNVKPGVTVSSFAPGEIWCYTVETYTDSARVPHFTIVDCYQIL